MIKMKQDLPPKITEELNHRIKSVSSQKKQKIMGLVAEEFKQMSVEPGECVGLVAAESIW